MKAITKTICETELSVVKQYDTYAQVYAEEIKENTLQSDSFYFLIGLLKQLKNNLSGGVWLDAGCGPGCLSADMFNMNYTKVIGVDLSEEMVLIARTKSVYSEVHHTSLADLSRLGTKVDVYFSNNALHFLNAVSEEHLEKALSEAHRVLKSGGSLVINMSSTGTSDAFIESYKQVLGIILSTHGVYDAESNKKGIKTSLIKPYPLGSISLKELVAKVAKAGFEVKTAIKRSEPISYINREQYVNTMRTYAKHLYLAPFAHLSQREQEHIFQEIKDHFIQDKADQAFVNDHFMNYVVAVKR